uniref:Uncharacterized protein n=1 Tax=uncultured Thiotrichaceae bacterium TaxID=298394 RepID=A0A6S6UKP1_9GAMM|nr:MAG: Unknown protein [uncultured Thiotrichaceae bacterium]
MNSKKLSLIISTPLLALPFTQLYAGGGGSNSHLYGMEVETVSTSSDFERHSINLNYGASEQGQIGFGGKAAHHRIENEHTSYRANEVKIRTGQNFNDTLYVEGGIGASRLKSNGKHQSENLTTYQVGARANLNPQISVGIQHEKDFAYKSQVLANQYGQILNAKTTKADVKYRPTKRIRIEADRTHRKFSDDNSSDGYKVGAYYGISPSWPYIWAGVEHTTLDFEHQDDGYWTPGNHRSTAATFTASFPVNDQLSMNSSLSVSRSKDDASNDYGTGYYASVGADLKLSPNSSLTANAHHIKSKQDDSDWDETGANIGLKFNHY